MKIPITMFHGLTVGDEKPVDQAYFDGLICIARELGFESINYDALDAWMNGSKGLPPRPIMFDFDHPTKSMRYGVHDVLSDHGYKGNLFVNTGTLETMYSEPLPPDDEREYMTWEEMAELIDLGWHFGAHTHTHPNLSELYDKDPSGDGLREELDTCDGMLKKHLGITPRDFAFTGTSWSSMAEELVMSRYRFGRLWIIQSMYQVDGKPMRYAELVGAEGDDEPDGGPPNAARYITKNSPRYRLPSMEIQGLIWKPDAFRRYLEGALET